MKKLKLFAFMLLMIAFATTNTNCSDESMPCEINNTGRVSFINNTSFKITLSLDGEIYTLNSGEQSGKDLSAGLHNYTAETSNGAYGWSDTIDIIQCGNQTISFVI
jgi:hypothetical protein